MWLLGLVSLHSFVWAARRGAWAVRVTTLDVVPDGGVYFDEEDKDSNVSLVADDENLWAADGKATSDALDANASANGTSMHNQSATVGDAASSHGGGSLAAVGAGVSENGTMDNQSDMRSTATWLAGGLRLAAVNGAQLSGEVGAAAPWVQAAVPLAPDLRRTAAAALGVAGGRCGNQGKGVYIGCNLGCACGWGSGCHSSLLLISGGVVDVGVCEASMPFLVAASLLLLSSCVGVVLAARVCLLSGEAEVKAPEPPSSSSKAELSDSSRATMVNSGGSSGSIHVFEPAMSESGTDTSSDYDVHAPRDSAPLGDGVSSALTGASAAPAAPGADASSGSDGSTRLEHARVRTISQTTCPEGSINLHRLTRDSLQSETQLPPDERLGAPLSDYVHGD